MGLSNQKVAKLFSPKNNWAVEESGRTVTSMSNFIPGGTVASRIMQPMKNLALPDDSSPIGNNGKVPQDKQQMTAGSKQRDIGNSVVAKQDRSAISSKIGASIINGRDRSTYSFSVLKNQTESTLKNRNVAGQEYKKNPLNF